MGELVEEEIAEIVLEGCPTEVERAVDEDYMHVREGARLSIETADVGRNDHGHAGGKLRLELA